MTKRIDTAAIAMQPETRLRFLEDFMGFTADDWDSILESSHILIPRLQGIVEGLYDHLLAYDDTRRIFLGDRGETDPQYAAMRKEHLKGWVLMTIATGPRRRKELASYLLRTGRRHTSASGETGRLVPPRYILGLTSFLQTAIVETIWEALADDSGRATRIALAWNKMLMIQLEMMLKSIAPYWPDWDERPSVTRELYAAAI